MGQNVCKLVDVANKNDALIYKQYDYLVPYEYSNVPKEKKNCSSWLFKKKIKKETTAISGRGIALFGLPSLAQWYAHSFHPCW